VAVLSLVPAATTQTRPRRRELRLGEALHLRLDELDVLDHRRGRHVARVDPRVHPDQGDRAVIDEAAKVCIRTAQLLLAMYYALQPGVFALSGWDLCGVLTLPTDAVADLLEGGPHRLRSRRLRQDAEARAGATVPGPGHRCGPASARSNGPRGIRATATAVTLSSAHRSWRRSCGRGRRWRHAGQRFAGPSF